jgi:hypothetical protein
VSFFVSVVVNLRERRTGDAKIPEQRKKSQIILDFRMKRNLQKGISNRYWMIIEL